MSRINITVEDLARIANDAVARRWDLAEVLRQATTVVSITHNRIETTVGVLGCNPALGYWYPAYLAEGYTRDDKGREVPLPPCTNLNGRPLTESQASLIALHEIARSGCTRIYRPALAGGGAL